MKAIKDSKWMNVMWKLSSLFALVFSIIAVCRSFCRTPDLEIDYMGVIVGILAILVTVLVTWNIYSAIDANNKIHVMENEIYAIRNTINQDIIVAEKNLNIVKAELYDNVVSINRHILGFHKTSVSFHLLINMISSISSLAKAEMFLKADHQIDYYYLIMKEEIEKTKSDIDKEYQGALYSLLYEIPNKEKLKSFSKLEELTKIACS